MPAKIEQWRQKTKRNYSRWNKLHVANGLHKKGGHTKNETYNGQNVEIQKKKKIGFNMSTGREETGSTQIGKR
jgi:hypothetical protein